MKSCLLIIPPFFDYPTIVSDGLKGFYDEVGTILSAPTSCIYKISSFLGLSFLKKDMSINC